jgi:hypothetical protein
MPYIKPEERCQLDPLIEPIVEYVKSLPMESQDGALNYLVTRTLVSVYPRRYFHYNRAMGVLSAIQHELYRVIVGPYEDEKIAENGPVEPCGDEKPRQGEEKPFPMHDIN